MKVFFNKKKGGEGGQQVCSDKTVSIYILFPPKHISNSKYYHSSQRHNSHMNMQFKEHGTSYALKAPKSMAIKCVKLQKHCNISIVIKGNVQATTAVDIEEYNTNK